MDRVLERVGDGASRGLVRECLAEWRGVAEDRHIESLGLDRLEDMVRFEVKKNKILEEIGSNKDLAILR